LSYTMTGITASTCATGASPTTWRCWPWRGEMRSWC